MICDALGNIGNYRGMNRNLDALIDWLGSHELVELEVGRTEIDGERLFANTMEATTRPAEGAHYELHHRYWDVQVDIEGREAFCVAHGDAVTVEPYTEKDDFALVDGACTVEGVLGEGRFAIFMEGEPHMPTLIFGEDGERPVKKVCFKVMVEDRA